jgi:transposase
MRNGITFQLSPEDWARLEEIVGDRNTAQKHAARATIVLLSAANVGTVEIMRQTGQSKPTVWRWQQRFMEEGVDGLLRDKTRLPGKKPLGSMIINQVLTKTATELPPEATQWSGRAMAKAVGISLRSVQRIWTKHDLKPHLVKGFKVSNDPHFAEKLVDIVGLYLDPPDKALVLAVDEKSQIQALDRTQPGLPLKKGRAGTLTHDYKRNGTTTLFAALSMLDGTVIGQCMDRHRHQEFIKFLRKIDRGTPVDLDLHLIADNYATHKHPDVVKWLERHPRFHLHFIPTSSSWLNLVERFFAEITRKRIRRGVFKSVLDLEVAIYRYLGEHNDHPKRFVWTKTADKILEKVERARSSLKKVVGTKC